MKKFLVSALAMFVLGSFGSVFAQASDAHQLDITIPQLLMIQIVDASGDVVNEPSVVFNISAADYLAVADGPTATTFVPTSSNFTDVQVLTNNTAWSVEMSASTLGFTPVVTGNTAAGLDLGDISVVDASDATLFALNTTNDIGSGSATSGWESLGFGGDDFRLALNGDEEPGTYSWTITYTVSAP